MEFSGFFLRDILRWGRTGLWGGTPLQYGAVSEGARWHMLYSGTVSVYGGEAGGRGRFLGSLDFLSDGGTGWAIACTSVGGGRGLDIEAGPSRIHAVFARGLCVRLVSRCGVRMVILGLDYGERRIGVAVSDELEIAAHGLENIERDEAGSELDCIAELVQERNVGLIVVGMPLNMDGSAGPQAQKVRGFVKELRRRVPELPIDTTDERLTSVQAHRALSEEGVTMRIRGKRVDRMAAQLILTRYLKRRATERGGRDESDQ